MDDRLQGVYFYASYDEALEALRETGDAEGELFLMRAMRDFMFRGIEPEKFPSRIIKGYWELMRPNLEASLKSARKYQSAVENGKLGGRPKKNPSNNPDHNPTHNPSANPTETQPITQVLTQQKPNQNPSETQETLYISGLEGDSFTENKNPTETQPITQTKPNAKPKRNPTHNPSANPNPNPIKTKEKEKEEEYTPQYIDISNSDNADDNNIYINITGVVDDSHIPAIPTLEDIKKHIALKGGEAYTSPEAFYGYYSDRCWRTNTGMPINWISALNGWIEKDRLEYERRQRNSEKARNAGKVKKTAFHDFNERDPVDADDLEKKLIAD